MPDALPDSGPTPEARIDQIARIICREEGCVDLGKDFPCLMCERSMGCITIARLIESEVIALALDAFRREERANARALRYAVETVRSSIFYWMTRNHNRGEKSYSKLGETKEQLTAAIKAYDDEAQS